MALKTISWRDWGESTEVQWTALVCPRASSRTLSIMADERRFRRARADEKDLLGAALEDCIEVGPGFLLGKLWYSLEPISRKVRLEPLPEASSG